MKERERRSIERFKERRAVQAITTRCLFKMRTLIGLNSVLYESTKHETNDSSRHHPHDGWYTSHTHTQKKIIEKK